MAIVGIAALSPDLVVLDEFQRFKDLLDPDPDNFASELAHRLFNFTDPDNGRPTRTLLLSATPYRMYTTADDVEGDHYADFVATCAFLFDDPARVERLGRRFNLLRSALLSTDGPRQAGRICRQIAEELRTVMARTERLAATPDRDGMLTEHDAPASLEPDDVRAYVRFGKLAELIKHHEPTEYWKSGPYLLNFMERYDFKERLEGAITNGLLPEEERLAPGPGLLNWKAVETYKPVDPQNGRVRWLLDDLERHRAFDLLWISPSMRYYDAGSVYESDEAMSFTKRLIFSGWALVPKVVSSLVSFEAERRAYAERDHRYTAEYRRRGGQRLTFRTEERTAAESRAGEAGGARRPAAMTALLMVWPSITLAELGDPRARTAGGRPTVERLIAEVEARIAAALEPLTSAAPTDGAPDQRWYWAAPILLDQLRHKDVARQLLDPRSIELWEGTEPGEGFRAHHGEARALAEFGRGALGRVPDDLVAVLALVALGGPAQCALRALSAATGLPIDDREIVSSAARTASAFRGFFNAPEITGLVARSSDSGESPDDAITRYWLDVVRHAVDGHLQAVLDEHAHVLREWLGYLDLAEEVRRREAASDIAEYMGEALSARTSSFRVDVPKRARQSADLTLDPRRMRSRFAVAFGNQTLDGGGQARAEAVSVAFNSPFWPFVLTSTSVGQEGLDFHLWCHAVVHWNLPSNPVDLEQREGRVHRYKGHAVRRNIAATVGPAVLAGGWPATDDPWNHLFSHAAAHVKADGEMSPYWVFNEGPARIERHVPMLPFSTEGAKLPQLRRTLAAYRLALGQPRQEELIEFLGAGRSDKELRDLVRRLRIDLTPPPITTPTKAAAQ